MLSESSSMNSRPVTCPVSIAGSIRIPLFPAPHSMRTFSLLSMLAALSIFNGGQETEVVWLAGTEIPPFFQVIVAAFSFGFEIDRFPVLNGAMKYLEK